MMPQLMQYGRWPKAELTNTSAPTSPIPGTRQKPLAGHSFLTSPMIPMLAHDCSTRFLRGKDCGELCVVFRDVPSEESPLDYLPAIGTAKASHIAENLFLSFS